MTREFNYLKLAVTQIDFSSWFERKYFKCRFLYKSIHDHTEIRVILQVEPFYVFHSSLICAGFFPCREVKIVHPYFRKPGVTTCVVEVAMSIYHHNRQISQVLHQS